jgi:hypothetical protein
MALKDLMGTLKEKTEGFVGDVAKGKVNEWLDEYKKAIAIMETFGFTVGKFTVGMGILPEIHTSISGSIENIREDRLKKMIEEHQAETLLVSLLNALITTRRFWEHVELKLTSVTLDITLGVPPKINVEYTAP